jgi:hypothetical protein
MKRHADAVKVLMDIWAERTRMEVTKASSRFGLTCGDAEMTDSQRMATFFAQAERVTRAMANPDSLRVEMVRLMAIGTAWVEYLDDTMGGDNDPEE